MYKHYLCTFTLFHCHIIVTLCWLVTTLILLKVNLSKKKFIKSIKKPVGFFFGGGIILCPYA